MTDQSSSRQNVTQTLIDEPDEIELLLESLERGFPVRLIATTDPMTCIASVDLDEVLTDRSLLDFDYVPVRDGEKIVGLLDRARFADLPPPERPEVVGTAMQRLDETNLISADDGILSFIEAAHRSPGRLVLDRKRITGIITISDLQKLPARPLLFLLVTHVELLMAEVIRATGKSDYEFMSCLSDCRQRRVEDKFVELQAANLAIDKLTATDFCDKREILRRIRSWPFSRNAIEKEFGEVEWLRNSLAHAGEYAGTRTNANRTLQAVRHCETWINRLKTVSRTSQ